MRIPYDPDHLSPLVLKEIQYFMALTALKRCAPLGTRLTSYTVKPLLLLPKSMGFLPTMSSGSRDR